MNIGKMISNAVVTKRVGGWKKDDVLPSGQKVIFVDTDGNPFVVDEPEKKQAQLIIKTMADLAKFQPGMKVYMPGPNGLTELDVDSVEQLLLQMAGKGEDATREQMYSPTPNFTTEALPSAADGHQTEPTPWPKPYSTVEAMNPVTRLGYGYAFSSNMDPGIAAPAAFKAPTPGRDPATGEPVPNDLRPVRKGILGHIASPENFDEDRPVKKGRLFGDKIIGPAGGGSRRDSDSGPVSKRANGWPRDEYGEIQ